MTKNLVTFLAFVLLSFSNTYPQPENNSFVSVYSESSIEIPADLIIFSINVEESDNNAQNAYDKLKVLEENLIKLLAEFDIPDSNISYSLTSINKDNRQNNNYKASENVIIKLYDFEFYEKFQLALLTTGINSFTSQFSSTKVKDKREEGFKIALEKARKEVVLITKNTDRKPGKILEIESRNTDFVVASNQAAIISSLGIRNKRLIDIPQHVNLITRIKVKYELK